jgi:ubiquinol-cytochrome c reductase cytochrome c subunit
LIRGLDRGANGRRRATVMFIVGLSAFLLVGAKPAASAPSASPAAVPSASATPAASASAAPSLTATPIAVQAPAGPGADIFAANCSGCHGVTGQGGVAVPTLPFPPPPLAAAGFASLVAPMVQQGGIQMPSFATQLTEAQIQAVAEYVSQEIADSAARTADASDGGQIYRLYCAGCHSTTGRGGAMARGGNAPDIAQYPAAEALAAMILGRGNMPVFAGHALDVRQQTSVALYVDVLVHAPSPGGAGLGYLGPVPEGAVGAAALLILIVIAVWLAWKSRKSVP